MSDPKPRKWTPLPHKRLSNYDPILIHHQLQQSGYGIPTSYWYPGKDLLPCLPMKSIKGRRDDGNGSTQTNNKISRFRYLPLLSLLPAVNKALSKSEACINNKQCTIIAVRIPGLCDAECKVKFNHLNTTCYSQ